MPMGRGVSGGMAVTCAGSGRMQRQVGGQGFGSVSGGSRLQGWGGGGWKWELRLTEHSEIGRSGGWMRKAIAGHTGIVASVVGLSGL